MIAVRLEDELLRAVDDLAAMQGKKRSAVVREAIVRYIEDLEDMRLAEQALREGGTNLTLKEMRAQLGLED